MVVFPVPPFPLITVICFHGFSSSQLPSQECDLEKKPLLGLELLVFFLGLYDPLPEHELLEKVIPDGLLQSLEAEEGTMLLPLGQAPERLNDVVIREGKGLVEGFADGHFGHHAGSGNRPGAPLNEKLNLPQAVFLFIHPDGHLDIIPAGRVPEGSLSVGFFQLPHISGVAKMLHGFFRVNDRFIKGRFLGFFFFIDFLPIHLDSGRK